MEGLRGDLGRMTAKYEQTFSGLEQAEADKAQLKEGLAEGKRLAEAELAAAGEKYDELKRQHLESEVEWKAKVNEERNQHAQQVERIERTHRA